VTQNQAHITKAGMQYFFTFLLEVTLACYRLQNRRPGDEALWREGAFHGLQFSFRFLSRFFVSYPRYIGITQRLSGGDSLLVEGIYVIDCDRDKLLPVFRAKQGYHGSDYRTVEINFPSIRQPRPLLQFVPQRRLNGTL